MTLLPSTQGVSPHHTLLPEIIARVLLCGIEDIKDNKIQQRYKYLLSASLVCKSWSFEARRLLWNKIRLQEGWRAKLLLKSPALNKYRTESLVLNGMREDSVLASEAMQIVSRLQGLKRVELAEYALWTALDARILTIHNLQSVESLTLENVTFHNNSSKPLVLPFALQELNLTFPAYTLSTPYNYSNFFHPSLLRLRISEPLSEEGLILLLILVAKRLQILELDMFIWDPSPAFDRTFSSFTEISDLRLGFYEQSHARAVVVASTFPPNQIKTLTLKVIHARDVSATVAALSGFLDCPTLTKIRTIKFPLVSHAEVMETEGGEEVLARWDRKGVSLIFE